ncbi:MAG: DNA polymerase III subunit delta' [Planctomycetota bacterium]|jgi:DNA polymerase-3 subunit delta'
MSKSSSTISWANILGQDEAWGILERSRSLSRIAHAYLFHGPRGVGKFTTARRFALLLLCDHPKEAEPCLTCPSCGAFLAGEHPDLDILAPPEGTRPIPIEAIREMSRRAWLTPSRASRRVFIIDDAHRLTEEAANSLLKTLEEPPPGTVILLITFMPEALLPTVLSRTLAIPFRALQPATCAQILAENHGVPLPQAEELLNTPAYSQRNEIFEAVLQTDPDCIFEEADRLLELAKASSPGSTLESTRNGLRWVFQLAGAFLRDIAVIAKTGREEEILNRENRDLVLQAVPRDVGRWAEEALAALTRARDALDRYVKPLLVVEWWLSSLIVLRRRFGLGTGRKGTVRD